VLVLQLQFCQACAASPGGAHAALHVQAVQGWAYALQTQLLPSVAGCAGVAVGAAGRAALYGRASHAVYAFQQRQTDSIVLALCVLPSSLRLLALAGCISTHVLPCAGAVQQLLAL
jgi:hypothetical protein